MHKKRMQIKIIRARWMCMNIEYNQIALSWTGFIWAELGCVAVAQSLEFSARTIPKW